MADDHEDYLEPGAAEAHHETHEDEGDDEISLEGLAGEPLDLSTHAGLPTVHQDAPDLISTHKGDPSAHHDSDHPDYIKKDGSRPLTSDWSLGTHKITGLVDPVVDHGATTKKYVDDKIAGYFGTIFPTHYERLTRPARSSVDTVTIYAKTLVNVNDKIFAVASDTALELNTNATWDTGTALTDAQRAGNDYYVYACDNSGTLALLVSANITTPAGYSADTSRKICGFHCLCVAVGTIGGHTLTDFTQGDILPQSVWDLKHRPLCEPEGMVWSDESQIWVDIYLASGTGSSTASLNGGTISDNQNWMDFVDDFGAVKKQLLDDSEFQLIAAGSNEETNINGSADPVTTGGHSDTAGRRMISNIGCEDCCGATNQWLRYTTAKYDDSIAAGWVDLPADKGSFYRPVDTKDIKLYAGGYWNDAAFCGSQCRAAHYSRDETTIALGGRGRSRGKNN